MALEAGRNAANADLAHTHKQLTYTHKHIQELLAQVTELEAAKHKLEQDSQEETLQLRQRLLTDTHDLHVCCCCFSCLLRAGIPQVASVSCPRYRSYCPFGVCRKSY